MQQRAHSKQILQQAAAKICIVALITCILMGSNTVMAQAKQRYIFLALGQSNMEGNAPIRPQDTEGINPRFTVMAAVDCPALNRTKGHWYTAIPPLCRCNTGVTLTDFFGRELVEKLPATISVGIINVSVGGCKIELFDQDSLAGYVATAPSWMQGMIQAYDGNPYARLVEMAKLAQQDGIIKGILLHQGESNPEDTLWTKKVKKVYRRLLQDLHLRESDVPLLAGETVHASQEGICAGMNQYINQLPAVIENAHVISSKGCTDAPDNLHFDAAGYETLGKRYAATMLRLLGY